MSILEQITNLSSAAAEIWKKNGYQSDNDFKGLIFHSISEMFPEKNPKSMKLKSSMWTIIDGYSFGSSEDENTGNESSPSAGFSEASTVPYNGAGYSSSTTGSSRGSTVGCFTDEQPLNDLKGSSPVALKELPNIRVIGREAKKSINMDTANKENEQTSSTHQISKSQYKCPIYDIYNDPIIRDCSAPKLPIDFIRTLVRAQVSVMMAQASQLPFNREPSSKEFEEMASSLCVKYPILLKTVDEETLSKMMKKRFTNVKSSKNTNKRPYKRRLIKEKDGNTADSESESTTPAMKMKVREWLSHDSSKKKVDGPGIIALLKQDFQSRRKTISSMSEINGELVENVLQLYPIFTDYRYIINEAILISGKDNSIENLRSQLLKIIDPVIYFSIQKKNCKPPGKKSYLIQRFIPTFMC
eukprot:TCONS_00039173-protein